jgi:hypothetical protein
MTKRLLVATLTLAALAPLAAHAHGGIAVSVQTPEFGIRIGAPVFRPYAPLPVYAPVPVFAPAPVYAPYPAAVYAPAPVLVAPPRVVYGPPIIVAPRVVYPRGYLPPPRVVVPYGGDFRSDFRVRPYDAHDGYRIPPGHANRYSPYGHYQ